MLSSDRAAQGLLSGVRILSFGTFVAGNICPLLLAELGADVVRVETKDRPEALRSYFFPDQAPVPEPSGIYTTGLFGGLARSTRSASIDMRTSGGRATLRELVRECDVLIENLGPGTMDAWGCSYAELHQLNPALVMLSMSGYGRSGPLAKYRAYASNINNHLGLTDAWAPDGTHFDFVAGIHGAHAVAAGLAAVNRGASGVAIDLAQTEAGATVMAPLYLDFLANGREWEAGPNEVPGSLLSTVVQCRGADAWVAIELEDVSDCQVICRFLEGDDLFNETMPVSASALANLQSSIAEWAKGLTPMQVTLKLQLLGLAAGPVQNTEDLWRDAQLRSRQSFIVVSHPDIGRVEYPDALDRLDRTPGRVASRAPRLGEHTSEVLQQWLGLDATAIANLESSGAVWQAREDPPESGAPALS